MRMQLRRIPKDQFLLALFGENPDLGRQLDKKDLLKILTQEPFKFNPEEIADFTSFLAGSTVDKIGSLILQNTEDWEIFNTSDEENFDNQLSLLILKNKKDLKKACKARDLTDTGFVSLEEFAQILNEKDVYFPPSLLQYISLLFYSHSYQLNSVPYKNFLKAYSQDEEDKANVVRSFLASIAQHLSDSNITVRQAFKSDKNGLIDPPSFLNALKRIGINEAEQDVVGLVLEALHFEGEEDLYVFIDELEEILEHYGVPSSEIMHRRASNDDSRRSL